MIRHGVTRAALALSLAGLAACNTLPALDDELRSEGEFAAEIPVPDADDYVPAEGSLWRGDVSRRFLAFENRAKQIGDLVTVIVNEEANAESEATTDVERTSSFSADLASNLSLQTLVTRPIRNVLSLLGFADQRNDSDPGNNNLDIVDATTASAYEGEGTVERESDFTATIACIVTGVTGSGLLHIQGERRITINEETQIIKLSGYVRPEDIQINNTVPSALVAAADIRFGGTGVVSQKQKVPWFARYFELFLPF